MGKRRWQRTGDDKKSTPIGPPTAESKRLARWRQKGDAPKGPTRSNLRVFAGIFSLVMVLALIVAAILLLKPLPRPHLRLIAAEYLDDRFPFNAFAVADAKALKGCALLDGQHEFCHAESTNATNLQPAINDLAVARVPRPWWGTEPTTLLVYVNALGYALWDDSAGKAVPYIFPNDFSPQRNFDAKGLDIAGNVGTLLKKVAASQADRKFVVLDCQKGDVFWQLGVVNNQFVEAVAQSVEAMTDDERKGLWVLSSCSPGEISWVDRDKRASTFGHYFLRGIEGEADTNRDLYVSIREIHTYVSAELADWSRSQRADIQTPYWLCAAGSIPSSKDREGTDYLSEDHLITLPWFPSRSTAPAGSRDDKEILDGLTKQWTQHFELAVRQPPPWHSSPAAWRDLQQDLLRTEELYRAGEFDLAKQRLDNIRTTFAASTRPVRGEGFSLAVDAYLNAIDPARSPAKNPFEQLLAEFENQDLPWLKEQLRGTAFQSRTRPIEIALAERLADADGSDSRMDLARDLILRRIRTEKIAAPASPYAPSSTRWIQSSLAEADGGRRFLEDDFLAQQNQRIPVHSAADRRPPAQVDAILDEADQNTSILLDAHALREQVLAEIPYFVALAAVRPPGDPNSFSAQEDAFRSKLADPEQGVDRLTDLLVQLNRSLAQDVDSKSRSDASAVIGQIKSLAEQVRTLRNKFLSEYADEAKELAKSDGPAETQTAWRRIDQLLQAPFPANPESFKESAERRVRILSRVAQSVQQGGAAPAQRTTGSSVGNIQGISEEGRRERAQRLALLAARFFQLSSDKVVQQAGDQQTSTQLGWYVAGWWRAMVDQARSADVAGPRADLVRADTAHRIADASETQNDNAAPSTKLIQLDQSKFFAWQARRAMDDFWAGDPEDDRDYFDQSAERFLDWAETTYPDDASRAASTKTHREELARRREAARSFESAGIATASAMEKVEFLVSPEQAVRLKTDLSQDLPAGLASLAGLTQSPALIVKPLTGDGIGFNLLAQNSATHDGSDFDIQLAFRGHRSRLALPVIMADTERGPTVVYINEMLDEGRYSLEADIRSNLKLLFVLDCSTSMLQTDQQGTTKIDALNQVLQNFADQTPPDTIDVGVRWFGAKAKRVSEADERLARSDSDNILPIRSFDPVSFLEARPDPKENLGVYTPMFHGVTEAVENDFRQVETGDKQIVLISDGGDSFFGQGLATPPWATIDRAKADNVKIHCIAFRLSDKDPNRVKDAKRSLERIAETTGGRYSDIDDAENLLREIKNITGQLAYSAVRSSDGLVVPREPATLRLLREGEKPHTTPPGLYDMKVMTPQNNPALDEAFRFLVEPGELHKLVYSGGRIRYNERADGGEGKAAPDGTRVKLLSRVRKQGGLEISFMVYRPADPQWRPRSIHVYVSPQDENRIYAAHSLKPNIPNLRSSGWKLRLESWNWDEGTLSVSWADDVAPIRIEPATLQVGGEIPGQKGMELGPTQPANLETVGAGFRLPIKIKFPLDARKEMHRWSITPSPASGKVVRTRNIYDPETGVATAVFDVIGLRDPEGLWLFPPPASDEKSSLDVRFQAGVNADN